MKKRLHTRFPATRIKKIMQTDEDVGKIANAVPLLVSKALELFLQDLCNHTYDVTLSRGAKTLSSFHLKQCVHGFNVFDFLKDIVGKVPDLGGSEGEDGSATKRRKVIDENDCNDEDTMTTQMVHEVKHTSGGRGRPPCRGRGRGGGRIGRVQKFEDDVENAFPRSSISPSSNESLSHEEKPEYLQLYNNHSNSGLKVRNFDLNVGLDENGDSPIPRLEENSTWSLFDIKEMKILPYQQQQQQEASAYEEDYDEESLD